MKALAILGILFFALNLYSQELQTQTSKTQKLQSQEPKSSPQTTLPNKLKTPKIKTHPDSVDLIDIYKNPPRNQILAIGPREMREKADLCEAKEDKNVCFEVGIIYYQGRSTYGQKLKDALHFFDRSCDDQKGLGCYEAGVISAHSKQYQYAFIFFEKSCKSGDLRGCRNLASLYYNGWGTAKNVLQATELLNQGCKQGDKIACRRFYFSLGDAYKDTGNLIGAKENYKKACELGDGDSCRQVELIQFHEQELYKQEVIQNNKKLRKTP